MNIVSRRPIRLISLMACFVPVLVSPARANLDHPYSPTYMRCMASGDAGQGVTSGIIDCINEEYARRDTILNQVYGATMARLPALRRLDLRRSERAWLAGLPVKCGHDQLVDGEIGQIELHLCYLDETIGRTAWLRRFT